MKDGKPSSREVVTVTGRVAQIDGVPCAVVRDRLFVAGHLAERTTDWYSQDRRGTVWYFGEATAELDRRGHVVSREGSWRAGAHGARPGIFMPARLRVGHAFVQERFQGHAEDHVRIVSLRGSVGTPFGTFNDALVTREWTPLEPGVIDRKHYALGIGLVSERSLSGPREIGALVSISHR